ncbi:Sugar kinase of the NBD/HSP70 family, may contain an N-terminal HTH domain [Gracilibacillus ureilyticus]|uniref:Sugar kinase of the NBD/HSP70 family, may contain an N-terminal HTH domain n=1 Tax=Gracilibacillus ureilyticus TaxID=531814 RepID=A0A1H9NEI0_9BACI|nr:ROK family protein [Gracilibacillus ureilyticus]SER34308.1 Sugar kinase of the NBD/HSP70 family, may contain an N-terminal HTH domain [Gracilibacillus ureilyticus]
MNTYLAIDIGGTFVKIGIVNEEGKILDDYKEPTPPTLEGLLQLINKAHGNHQKVKGIAVSSPGAVSDHGCIYGSSAVRYLHGPNIKELIQNQVHLPVFLGNDANCAAYAEMWQGAATGLSDFLVTVIGTGIGGALIKNGQIHKGANLHGGEFGFMLLDPDTIENDGVWSRIASTKALVKKVAKAKQTDPALLTGEMIFQMAEDQDPVCQEAVDRFYHLLAVGIYNLQYIYDPEVILIGGGISERGELIEKINEKLDDIINRIELARIKPVIKLCQYRQHANLLGAVYGYRQQFKD